MNDSIKKKINAIGKVGYVIAVVLLVLSIIGTVMIAAVTIGLIAVPEDLVTLKVGGSFNVSLGGRFIGSMLENAEEDEGDFQIGREPAEKLFDITVDMPMDESKINQGEGTLDLSGTVEPQTLTIKSLILPMLTSVFGCGCLIVVFTALAKLMKAFKDCGSPFTQRRLISRRYRLFLWLCSILSEIPYGTI